MSFLEGILIEEVLIPIVAFIVISILLYFVGGISKLKNYYLIYKVKDTVKKGDYFKLNNEYLSGFRNIKKL